MKPLLKRLDASAGSVHSLICASVQINTWFTCITKPLSGRKMGVQHKSPFWTIQRFLWTCSRQGFLFVRQNLFHSFVHRADWLAFVQRSADLCDLKTAHKCRVVPLMCQTHRVLTFCIRLMMILLRALCPIMLLSFTEFNVAKLYPFVFPMTGVLWIRTNMSSSKYALFHSPSQFKIEAQNKRTFTERAETLKHNFSFCFSLCPLV